MTLTQHVFRVSLALVGYCAGCGSRPHSQHSTTASTQTDAAPSPTFDDAMVLYQGGRLSEALTTLESAAEPWAQAYRLLLLNRPAEVLNLPPSSHPRMLKYRALAAWRTGNADELDAALDGISGAEGDWAENGVSENDVLELRAMSALANSALDHRLRRVTLDVPAPATFDASIGVPIIEVLIGGKPARFVFDTGAEVSVVTPEAAVEFGVATPEGAKVRGEGNAGATTSSLGLIPQMAVLGRSIEAVPVVLADLHFPPQFQIQGIVAVQDLLGDGVLRIVYQRGIIERHVSSSDRGDSMVFLDMVFLDGRAVIGVQGRVEEAGVGAFLIDTGARRSTLVDAYVDAAKDAGASWSLSEPVSVEIRALGHAHRERRFIEAIRWCSSMTQTCVDLEETPVDTTPADASTIQVGKLGANAFAGRVLELDYEACRLRLN